MIDSFFAGYGVGSGVGTGVGGPQVGIKTAFAVTGLAAVLGILYLALRKPDPPGYWREKLDGPDPALDSIDRIQAPGPTKAGPTLSQSSRADQVRGWGTHQ